MRAETPGGARTASLDHVAFRRTDEENGDRDEGVVERRAEAEDQIVAAVVIRVFLARDGEPARRGIHRYRAVAEDLSAR